jgi:hypothetical protein
LPIVRGLEALVEGFREIEVRARGLQPQAAAQAGIERQPVLLDRRVVAALQVVGRAEIDVRAGDDLRLDVLPRRDLEDAMRIVDRALELLQLGVDRAQVEPGGQHRAAVADALEDVERALFVLQRLAQLARTAREFAPRLRQHAGDLVGHVDRAADLLRALEHRLGARVVALQVQPRQARQRGQVGLDRRVVRLLRVGLLQALRAVFVAGERAIGIARLVECAQRAIRDAHQQLVARPHRDLQRLLAGLLRAIGHVARARQRGARELDLDAIARAQRTGRKALDQRVGLGMVGRLQGIELQRMDEAAHVARREAMPECGSDIVPLQRTLGLAPMPRRACVWPVETLPPRNLVLQPAPQRKAHRHANRLAHQQLAHRAFGAVEVAVERARAHAPQPAQVLDRRLVEPAPVALAKLGHRQQAGVAGGRQHRSPGRQVEPGLAVDALEARLAVRPQLRQRPAQQQVRGQHQRLLDLEGVAHGADQQRLEAPHQPARSARPLAHQLVERAGALRGQRSFDQGRSQRHTIMRGRRGAHIARALVGGGCLWHGRASIHFGARRARLERGIVECSERML